MTRTNERNSSTGGNKATGYDRGPKDHSHKSLTVTYLQQVRKVCFILSGANDLQINK